jgi:hypothetical protein
MLREIICKHIKPRCATATAVVSASTATLTEGYGDVTITRTGTGAGVLTRRTPYTRAGMFFLSQQTTTGGYVSFAETTSATLSAAATYTVRNQAGTAVDGTFSAISFGFNSSDVSLCQNQKVASSGNMERIIYCRVTGSSGAVVFGATDFRVTRTGTGIYSVVFKRSFSQVPTVIPTGISSAGAADGRVTNLTAEGCTITMAAASTSPSDLDFYLVVLGQNSRSDAGKEKSSIQSSQRKPRIVVGQITNTGGTPTLTVGGATGGIDFTTLTDNGAGDFSVTIAAPFARQPAVMVSSTAQRANVHSLTGNILRLQTRAGNGTLTDVTGITNFLCIGTDVNEEF